MRSPAIAIFKKNTVLLRDLLSVYPVGRELQSTRKHALYACLAEFHPLNRKLRRLETTTVPFGWCALADMLNVKVFVVRSVP